MPSPTRRKLFLTAAVLTALWVVVLGAVSLTRKVESFQPLGFSAHAEAATWRVDAVSDTRTGLAVGDRIVLVNASEPRSARDLSAALRQNAGAELLVERAGIPVQVSYERPPLAIDWHYLFLALIGLGYLFIGFYTLLRDQRRAARLFYLWCLTSGLVYLATAQAPFDTAAKIVYVFDGLGLILLAPLTLHLFLVFPRPLARLEGRLGWIPFLYLPAAFLTAVQADLILASGRWLAGGQTAATTQALDQWVLYHLVAFGLAAGLVLASRLRRRHDSEPLRQAAWVAVGMLGGYLPFLALYVAPRGLGLDWPPLLTTLAILPLALVPLTFAYAILRYKLWDIGIIVRDTLSLATTLLIGVVGFSVANLVIQRSIPADLVLPRTLLSVTSGLFVAGLMIPTRRRIGASLERLQYGGAFHRRRGLLEFGREMLEERDLDNLSSSLLGELGATFDLARANLYLGQTDILTAQRDDGGVLRHLRASDFDDAFWTSDVRSLSGAALPGELTTLDRLHAAGYRYAFALTSRHRRFGVLVIGYKRGESPLSSADIDLVRNLLSQVSQLRETTDEILESSPAGIAVVDRNGVIERANAALGRIFEATPETLAGRSLSELLGDGALPRPNERLREMRFRSPSGEDHYLQVSVAALPSGRTGATVVLVQDVTERIAIENAMREQDRLASLGMLAAGVAHEVNTPITGISSYAQMLLQSTPEGDPRRALMEKVERQTFRASRIVNNLLEFSRDRPREPRPVSLNFVVSECLDLLKERLRDGNVTLVFDKPDEEITTWGSDGELLQVFTNLVVNASDAMSGGGTLRISFETTDDWITVGVEDSGPGIPSNQLDQIFQPFFSTKLKEGGTGLGLSISYNIVQRHGGHLRVASVPGEGSTFFVELPRHQV